jgi:hypothetical protein
MKHWEIIADNLSKAGWSWGCVSAMDSNGRTIWIVDVLRSDEKQSNDTPSHTNSTSLRVNDPVQPAAKVLHPTTPYRRGLKN